jgi:1-acyl-sn-glycerol-3-phosphate acyltransferase
MSIYLIILLLSVGFVKNKRKYTDWWKRFWCQTACWILGIRLKLNFDKQSLPDHYLIVSNHASLMDPVITLAVLKGMPVAKAEIANYPIIGFAAKRTGIIWVERSKTKSRNAARKAVESALDNGQSVLVYPEGTISYSPTKLRNFKKGALDAAIRSNAPILFCAIYYKTPNAFWREENSLLKQFLKHFSTLSHEVHLHISMANQGGKAQLVSNNAKSWIEKELNSIADAAEKD